MPKSGDFLNQAQSWIVTRRRGQLIFDSGEPSKQMYRVEAGCVRLQVNGDKGVRQIVVFLFPGDFFGYDIDSRVCAAEAASDCTLRCWSVRAVLKAADKESRVTVKLLGEAQRRFGQIAEHMEKITHLPATERVIWFIGGLLRCRGLVQDGGHIHLPMSYADIADYLGLAPETLSRVLAALESNGYVRREGRHDLSLNAPMFLKIDHLEALRLDA